VDWAVFGMAEGSGRGPGRSDAHSLNAAGVPGQKATAPGRLSHAKVLTCLNKAQYNTIF